MFGCKRGFGCKSWVWLAMALPLLGCDDSKAPKPKPLPPEIEVPMQVHFGRPGATMGMALRLVANAEQVGAPDAVSVLSEATGLEPAVIGLADLLQPADLLLVDSAGSRHRLVSMVPVPDLAENLPAGLKMAEGSPTRVVGSGGQARCVVESERLWCSPSAGEQLGGLARAAKPTVDKWARDHTDAVIELDGETLRNTVWPTLRGDAAILTARLSARLAHRAESLFATFVATMGKASFEPLLAVVDRAVVRLRLDGRQARIEARVDVDPKTKGEVKAALEALHGSTPLASALGHLPPDLHGLVLRADVGLWQGVVFGEVVRLARGQADAMERLTGLEGTLLPGVVAGVIWAGERRVLLEAQRSRDPEATAKALAELSLSLSEEGTALSVRPASGGVTIEIGSRSARGMLVDDVLVIASGVGMKADALAAVIPDARAQPTGMAAALAPHVVGLGLQVNQLARAGSAAGTFTFGFRVTEKTPQHLRGAFAIQADRPALLELSQLLRLGRAKRPDPVLTRSDADDAGETPRRSP